MDIYFIDNLDLYFVQNKELSNKYSLKNIRLFAELLLGGLDPNSSSSNVQNILDQILENYWTYFGRGLDLVLDKTGIKSYKDLAEVIDILIKTDVIRATEGDNFEELENKDKHSNFTLEIKRFIEEKISKQEFK